MELLLKLLEAVTLFQRYKVITPAEQPKMPDVEWNWNETKVDAVVENKDNNIIKAKEIEVC